MYHTCSLPGSGGYLGELTMMQLYNVALTAGKAHKDHKHHHAHHYEHDTSNNTPRTTTQAPITGPPLPPHPFLTGGQINTQVYNHIFLLCYIRKYACYVLYIIKLINFAPLLNDRYRERGVLCKDV